MGVPAPSLNEAIVTSMPPILVAELFPAISRHLLELLRSLRTDEWQLPTISSQRTVKDIASHLLDGSLRRLSMQRDGHRPADAEDATVTSIGAAQIIVARERRVVAANRRLLRHDQRHEGDECPIGQQREKRVRNCHSFESKAVKLYFGVGC